MGEGTAFAIEEGMKPNNPALALKSPVTLARFELFLNVFVRKPASVTGQRSRRKG